MFILPKKDEYCIKVHTPTETLQLTEVNAKMAKRIITYCKYQSGMSITDSRRPQLGAMDYEIDDKQLKIRLSSVGNFNDQESMVLRIIYDDSEAKSGLFYEDQVDELKQLCAQRGLVLFSGPTGSGKTTTIYKIVRELKNQEKSIVMSIEDPVEIFEESFLQLEVNGMADMMYSDLLKLGLRLRPDIFIIGEIRDAETARTAVEAALSGHLVFSTVHAKSPNGTIQRLLDLGVDRERLECAINTVAYQRLIPNTNGDVRSLLTIKSAGFFDNPDEDDMKDWRAKIKNLNTNGVISDEAAKKYEFG